MDELKMGIYCHYKGHLYQVLGVAEDVTNDTPAERVVVYMPLEITDARPGPRMKVRDLAEFLSDVEVPYGADATRMVPRFKYLGPELTEDMM